MLEGKLLNQKSRMSGVSIDKLNQAFKTFENGAGPGQYEKPDLNGGNLSFSKTRNMP